ncbi:uncharacterized protein LOC100207741 isoform X2 [Hydra vulgaris]|uniref:uncharacterized protein LOC100207741 isoform X2 n=1 Tax=Hydra vulgaris TaxID=6087 RepID=UPI001F5F343C|nr:uncharacterized protein LOC100207741 isoform X2 [Hydra vulgaris]
MYVFVILVLGILNCNAFDISRSKKDGKFLNIFVNPMSNCWYKGCWKLNGSCRGAMDCCFCKCSDGKVFYSNKLGCLLVKNVKLELQKIGKDCGFFDTSIAIKYVPIYALDTDLHSIEIAHNGGLNLDRCSAGVINLYDYHEHTKVYKRNECQNLFSTRYENKKLYLNWHSNSSDWNGMKGQLMSVQINCDYQSNSSCFLFQVQGSYSDGNEIVEPTEVLNCTEVLPIKTTSETNIHSLSAANTSSSTSHETSKITNSSTSIIVGSAVCVVLLLILIGLFVVCWRKRKSMKNMTIESRSRLISQQQKKKKRTTIPSMSIKVITKNECDYECIETENNCSLKQYNTLEKNKIFYHQEDSKSITGTLSKRPLPDRPLEASNPYYAPSVSNIEAVYLSSTEPIIKRPTSCTSQLTRNDLNSTYASADTLNEYDIVPTSTPYKTDSYSLNVCKEGPIYENTLSSTTECEKEPVYDAPKRFVNNECDPLCSPLYSSISDIKNANESFYKDDVKI